MNNLEKNLQQLPKYRLGFFASLKISLKILWSSVNKYLNNNFMRKAQSMVALAVAVLVVLGGTTAYAYSSVSVTAGSALFPLKSLVESVQVALADDGLEKVQVLLDQAERRVEEAKYLANGGTVEPIKASLIKAAYAQDGEESTNLSETLDEVVETTEEAINEAETISEPIDAEVALVAVEESQEVQEAGLTEIAASADLSEDSSIEVALALAETQENQEAVVEAQAEVLAAVVEGEDEVEIEVETVTKKERKGQLSPEKIAELQAAYASKKAEWQAKLTEAGVTPEDSAKLLERVTNMESKIAAAVESGNLAQARGLLKAASALQNNAKHFIKKAERQDEREQLREETQQKIEVIREEFKQKREELKTKREQLREELKNFEGTREERKDFIETKREELKNELEQFKETLQAVTDEVEEANEADEVDEADEADDDTDSVEAEDDESDDEDEDEDESEDDEDEDEDESEDDDDEERTGESN